MIEQSSRNSQIDVLRGIGCIYVILGHLHPGILETHIYSFHMFLFFFLSGYLYRKSSLKNIVTKNLKKLVVPFLCGGGVAELISLILSEPIEGGAVPALFYYKGVLTWNRPIWFLLVLFEATVLTHLLERFTLCYYLSVVVSIVIGFLIQGTNYSFGLSILPVAYSQVGIGYFSNKALKKVFNAHGKAQYIFFTVFVVLNICFSYVLNTRISMVGSYYGNYVYAFIAGFSGIVMYWYISKWICSNKILERFGKHGVLLITTQYIIFRFFSELTKYLFNYDIWKESSLVKALIVANIVAILYYLFFIIEDRFLDGFKKSIKST